MKVSCSKCGRVQEFRPYSNLYLKWKKTCVFCNTCFLIYPKLKQSRVVSATKEEIPR